MSKMEQNKHNKDRIIPKFLQSSWLQYTDTIAIPPPNGDLDIITAPSNITDKKPDFAKENSKLALYIGSLTNTANHFQQKISEAEQKIYTYMITQHDNLYKDAKDNYIENISNYDAVVAQLEQVNAHFYIDEVVNKEIERENNKQLEMHKKNSDEDYPLPLAIPLLEASEERLARFTPIIEVAKKELELKRTVPHDLSKFESIKKYILSAVQSQTVSINWTDTDFSHMTTKAIKDYFHDKDLDYSSIGPQKDKYTDEVLFLRDLAVYAIYQMKVSDEVIMIKKEKEKKFEQYTATDEYQDFANWRLDFEQMNKILQTPRVWDITPLLDLYKKICVERFAWWLQRAWITEQELTNAKNLLWAIKKQQSNHSYLSALSIKQIVAYIITPTIDVPQGISQPIRDLKSDYYYSNQHLWYVKIIELWNTFTSENDILNDLIKDEYMIENLQLISPTTNSIDTTEKFSWKKFKSWFGWKS